MGAALAIRRDLVSGEDLRRLVQRERNRRTATWMLAIANALDGMSRAEAARLVGMERQGRAGQGRRCGMRWCASKRRRAGRLARPAEAGPPAYPERGRTGAACEPRC